MIFLKASMNGKSVGHISWNFDETFLRFVQVLQFVKVDFQHKNVIKHHLQACLKLNTLNA
jgi:hypothetical protein